jgi:hypothetical protein
MATAADRYGWAEIARLQQQAASEGRTFDPSDPYNWKGIAAGDGRVSIQPVPNPANGDGQVSIQPVPTPAITGPEYSLPNLSDDLQYVAWLQGYEGNKAQANADAELRRGQADLTYKDALSAMEQQGLITARNQNTSLISRGVLNSGETERRRDELVQTLSQQRQGIDTNYNNQLGTIEADKMRALTQLENDRTNQIAASKARMDARAATLTNSGTVNPAPSAPAPQSSAADSAYRATIRRAASPTGGAPDQPRFQPRVQTGVNALKPPSYGGKPRATGPQVVRY